MINKVKIKVLLSKRNKVKSGSQNEEKSYGVPHPHVSSLTYNCRGQFSQTRKTNGKTPRDETMYVEYGLVPGPRPPNANAAMHSIQGRAAQCCRLTWISPVLSMSLTPFVPLLCLIYYIYYPILTSPPQMLTSKV